eukprot:6175314-Alexandrium_andersonii.AAC.1
MGVACSRRRTEAAAGAAATEPSRATPLQRGAASVEDPSDAFVDVEAAATRALRVTAVGLAGVPAVTCQA